MDNRINIKEVSTFFQKYVCPMTESAKIKRWVFNVECYSMKRGILL